MGKNSKKRVKKTGKEIAISGLTHSEAFAKDVIQKLSGLAENEIIEATTSLRESLLKQIKEIDEDGSGEKGSVS